MAADLRLRADLERGAFQELGIGVHHAEAGQLRLGVHRRHVGRQLRGLRQIDAACAVCEASACGLRVSEWNLEIRALKLQASGLRTKP